jgi:hypothetical protein
MDIQPNIPQPVGNICRKKYYFFRLSLCEKKRSLFSEIDLALWNLGYSYKLNKEVAYSKS